MGQELELFEAEPSSDLAIKASAAVELYEKVIAPAIIVEKSTHNWKSIPGQFDTLNMGCMFPSTNRYEFPDVAASFFTPASLAAWHEPKQRAVSALDGGAIHFYLDDYRFESAWRFPDRGLVRLRQVGAAIAPDFSVYRDMPQALQMYQIYRSRWCAAYWNLHGVEVVPSLAWGDPSTYDFVFDGLPYASHLCIGTMGWKTFDKDHVGRAFMRQGLREAIDRLAPTKLIVYGKLRHCDDLDLPEVHECPTFWDQRRPPRVRKELLSG